MRGSSRAAAVVIVNSASPGYLDFQLDYERTLSQVQDG